MPQGKEIRLFLALERVWKPIFFYCMILVYKLVPFFGEIKKKDSSKGEIAKLRAQLSVLGEHYS